MDNNQRYNEFEEQFNNLPLPNEEQSWQQMKQMLDEEDKNRRPVVPFLLRSCAGWGLALLIIGAVTWFTLKPQRWWQQQGTGSQTETAKQNQGKNTTTPVEDDHAIPGNNFPNNPGQTNGTTDESLTKTATGKNSSTETNGSVAAKTTSGTGENGASVSLAAGTKKNLNGGGKSKIINSPSSKQKGKPLQTAITAGVFANKNNPNDALTNPPSNGSEASVNRSLPKDSLINKTDTQTIDTVGINNKNVLVDTTAVAQNKDKKIKKSPWIVSAGVGLQQQIPVGGQEAVPYDYYGRSGSLSDYIPSIYLRLEKENKWFVQGEFRYGAPQTLEDFQYSKQTKVDPQNMTVTTYRLKKTYYHQLPFSFNYYVMPNWTVGVGGIYNRFYGAVTEKEVNQTDLQTQVETMSREIVNIQHFNDSFLYKTQVHALVQTEYHWKRFDFGLRYTKDIQPYIKYTQPDGRIDDKKNQTFQLLVRYRIWQSRKKISG